MTEELKPCPFCGGKVTLSTYRGEGYQIVCTNHNWPQKSVSDASVAGDIGLYSWGLGDEAKAALIAAWNRRAS